ncbi:hypothetical protein ABID99_003690 [Mucilaginibacter sp. OAE612]
MRNYFLSSFFLFAGTHLLAWPAESAQSRQRSNSKQSN